MSLEAAVAENTAAIKALTEAVAASNAGREAAVAAISAAAPEKPARQPRQPKPAAAETPAPAAAAPAPTPTPAPQPAASTVASTVATIAQVREAAGVYMSVNDPVERTARRDFVKSMLDHYGVKLMTEVPEEFAAQALGWIKAKTAGQDVNFSADEGPVEEPDADDDMLG